MPGSPVGILPCMIKNEFTIGVALFIERHGANQASTVVNRNMTWLPAEMLANAAITLHGVQELVANKRIAIPDKRIPRVCRDRGNLGVNLDFHLAKGLLYRPLHFTPDASRATAFTMR